jgi:hypothetical protein
MILKKMGRLLYYLDNSKMSSGDRVKIQKLFLMNIDRYEKYVS